MVKSSTNTSNLLKTTRCLILFYQAIRSESTRANYEKALSRFFEFAKTNYDPNLTFESLVSIPQDKGQILLEDYLIYLKHDGKSYDIVKTAFQAIKHFFSMSDRMFNWDKIKKMRPEKKAKVQDIPHSKETISLMLGSIVSLEIKAVLMVLASSGCRVGMVEHFRICDMKPMSNGCQRIVVYAEDKEEYSTFITQEAFGYVQKWLDRRRICGESLTERSLVFTKSALHYSIYFSRLCKKLNVSQKVTRYRKNIAACHGLRKRFNTLLKTRNDVNPNLAERLLGHSTSISLDNSYFRPTIDALFDTYQKIIPELTIDESYLLQMEIAQKDEQIKTLQNDKDQRIKELEQKLEMIFHHLSNLSLKV